MTFLFQMLEEQCRCTDTMRSLLILLSQFSLKDPWCRILENSDLTFESEFSTTKLKRIGPFNFQNKTLHSSLLSVAVFSLTFNVKSYKQCNHYFERLFCSLMDLIVRKWFLIFSQNQAFQKQVLFAHFPPLIFMANVDISFMGFFF